MNATTMTEPESQEKTSLLTVANKMGIHARPAAMIVRVANKYDDTEVWVRKDTEQVNGKSIMGLMMLAAGSGAKLNITALGPSAEALLRELSKLFERKFEEA
jgi:phosphocarrier protein